jgi:hypothetical protein
MDTKIMLGQGKGKRKKKMDSTPKCNTVGENDGELAYTIICANKSSPY